MTPPRISLIIPVYNRPEMIRECLASLAPSLTALHEVIVVDDGSTDGRTPQAVQQALAALEAGTDSPCALRLIEQDNAGPGAARNTGAEAASGAWLAFLDSDDIWLPWSGTALAQALNRHPDIAVLCMNVRHFWAHGELDGFRDTAAKDILCDTFFELTRIQPLPVMLGGGYFALPRQLFLDNGGFVTHLRGSEDTDLFYRLSPQGKFLGLQHPVLVGQRCANDDSLTRNAPAFVEGVEFLMRRYRAGHYTEARPGEIEQSLADLLAFWLHDMFWQGHGKAAYGVLFSQGTLGIMWRRGHRKAALKLLFIPLLALLRPKNHRFRWHPKPDQA